MILYDTTKNFDLILQNVIDHKGMFASSPKQNCKHEMLPLDSNKHYRIIHAPTYMHEYNFGAIAIYTLIITENTIIQSTIE